MKYNDIYKAERNMLVFAIAVVILCSVVIGWTGSAAVVEHLGDVVDYVLFDDADQVATYKETFK